MDWRNLVQVFALLSLLFSTQLFSETLMQMELAVNRTCAIVEVSGTNKISCMGRAISIPSISNPTKLSLGRKHLCAANSRKLQCMGSVNLNKSIYRLGVLKSGRDVVCWSEGPDLFCKGKGPLSLLTPPGTIKPIQIDIGQNHACVIDQVSAGKRQLKCWGDNTYDKSDVPKSLINPVMVSTGKDFTCVIDETAKDERVAFCFGTRAGSRTIAPVLKHPLTIQSGKDFTCAIDLLSFWGETSMKCWGETKVLPGLFDYKDPTMLRASDFHMCAFSDSDGLNCHGLNAHKELDLSSQIRFATISPSMKVKVDRIKVPPENILATGIEHACAITKKGVKCWGRAMQSSMPVLEAPVQLAAGQSHTCALDKKGVKCWGNNSYRQLNVPTLVEPIKLGTSNSYHTCAIQKNGQLKCWGYDYNKQVSSQPKLKLPVKEVTAGGNFTCALDQENVKCWGNNYYKQLNVPIMKGVKKIQAGYSHACALHSAGVTCWGDTSYKKTTPPSLSNPVNIGTGSIYSCAQDGKKFKCWGYTGYKTHSFPAFTDFRGFSLGGYFACGIDGKSIKCWGSSRSGVLSVPKLEL